MRLLNSEEEARAAQLHRDSLVVDTKGGGGPSAQTPAMVRRLEELATQRAESNIVLHEMGLMADEALVRGELDGYWEGWEKSGVDVSSSTVGIFGAHPFTFENAVRDLALWTRIFDAVDRLVKVTKGADAERAHREGKRGIILNLENTTHIGDDLDRVKFFYDFGIRIIQLTYNSRNLVGDGCTERNQSGLSHFGLSVVRRLNDLGIIIDLSHCGERTCLDAAEVSDAPMAITHSCAKAIHDHHRAKSDEVIRAVGERGYFGVLLVPFFLTSDPQPTLDHFVAHFNHVVDLIGPDHVGIGTDWGLEWPKLLLDLLNEEMKHFGFRQEHGVDWHATVGGYASWTEWPNLTRALVAEGYSANQIRGFLGGNFLRLFREVVG